MTTDSTQLPPQGHIASFNDIQMYYEVYGEGEPLVLLHGFTQAASFWHPYIADFVEHFRLIVPDLRGHGHSTNPANQFTFRQSAADVFALLDQLEIAQYRAIGLSAGALTILHMATKQPSRVEAQVLIGMGNYLPEQARSVYRRYTPDSEEWNWELLRQRHVRGDEQIRAIQTQLHNFKDSYDDVNFTPPYLSTITAKTLIINGDRDAFFPVALPLETYQAIPNSYLWIVPNGEHWPFTEAQTKLFTQTALEFLRGNWE